MSIKKPTMPLSSGAEPLEPLAPQDLQKVVKGERFESALNQLESQVIIEKISGTELLARGVLANIANNSKLSPDIQLREAARYMVSSRLQETLRETEQGENLINDLSEYIAEDPLLGKRLLSILQKLKSQ